MANVPDPPLLQGLREKLVHQLRRKGIENKAVLAAIETVKRHAFVPVGLAQQAYLDKALPIAKDQTISQPYTVAYQTELLKIKKGDRVLEIGTGSGYQCAILCELGADVYSIERHEDLHRQAKKILSDLGYKPVLKSGDGTLGWPTHAPFDGIVVTAGGPEIPTSLREQLAIGGRLVIPIGGEAEQRMVRITRLAENEYEEEAFDEFRFVPLIGEEGW